MKKDFNRAIADIGRVVDVWLPRKVLYSKTPGMSVGIMYDSKLAYTKSFGVADEKKGGTVTEHSLFHIASISKTFTAVAILQLQEKGKLKLDDKISKYIPWFVGKSANGDIGAITIRQVMSHAAGLFRDGTTPQWVTGDFPKNIKDSFSPAAKVLKNKSSFKYSNYGFAVLGAVIESVTKDSFENYIQQNIFTVLGMAESSVDYNSQENIVTGHGNEIPNEERELFPHFKANAYAPATGFVSSVVDLAKFGSALSFTYTGPQILSLASKKMLAKAHEKTEDGDKYGLGVDIMKIFKHITIGHSGGFHGFSLQFIIDQKTGLGVVVLTNNMQGPSGSIAKGLMEGMYRLLDTPGDFSSKIKIEAGSARRFEGIYRNLWGEDVVVALRGLLVSISSEASFPLKYKTRLIPQKESDTFLMKTKSVFTAGNELAKFSNFKDGKAQTLFYGPTPSKRVG